MVKFFFVQFVVIQSVLVQLVRPPPHPAAIELVIVQLAAHFVLQFLLCTHKGRAGKDVRDEVPSDPGMKTVGGALGDQAWLGATICNEAYRSRAEIAAQQFFKSTGCPAVIIDEADFAAARRLVESAVSGSHVPPNEIPQAAKLFLFDLLDADNLVYFDADLLFIRPFDPSGLPASGMLRVVRDFWWNGGVISDCLRNGIDASRYFNSGLMVMQRGRHAAWLEEARRVFVELDNPVFREQSSLNIAAQRMELPVHYLPRDMNVIYGANTDELRTFSVTGLHLLHWFPPEDYGRMIREHENTGVVCTDPASTGLAGEWIYDRVGIGQRRIEFLPDGSIGSGTAACERFWRVWHEGNTVKLGVFGHAPGQTRIKQTLEATAHGDEWHGKWLRFEKNDVTLRRFPRATVRARRAMSIDKLTLAIVTCDRQPAYVHETLASLFACDPLVHALPKVHLVVGNKEARYLDSYRHHERIRIHTLDEQEYAAIADWGVHRNSNHTHWRGLSLPVREDGGLCIFEDDVIFRDGFFEKLLATIDEMECGHGMEDYVLALTAAYDFEREPTFYRGQRFCSYGYGFYGIQGMYYPDHIRAQLRDHVEIHGVKEFRNPCDLLVGTLFRHCLYTCPRALVYHIGTCTTGLGGAAGSPSFHRPYRLIDQASWGQVDV